VAQSSGTDPMADDEPRHCFFPVIRTRGEAICSAYCLVSLSHRSTAQSLVDNVRIVWKQFGTRVFFFFKRDDKEVRGRREIRLPTNSATRKQDARDGRFFCLVYCNDQKGNRNPSANRIKKSRAKYVERMHMMICVETLFSRG
jgi:hypothetical protein